MVRQPSQEFGRFRSLFCPVHKRELKLFFPLLLMFFFICFNYCVLRVAKDSLVITAPASGAEILPFIKVWMILPMALVMTLLFTRLANRFSTEKVFYIMMSIFLGFFLLFALVLYPLKEALHPTAFADWLSESLPIGYKGFVAMLRNWSYAIFYVMAELWGTTIMTVLFWGFANEVLNVNIAKRFYVLIMLGGNLATICAGELSTYVADEGMHWGASFALDPWQCSLWLLTALILCSGGLTVLLFRYLHVHILRNQSFAAQLASQEERTGFKMSLRKNFHYLAQSKYLICIALIVVSYNICINLTEITWKDQVLRICPGPNEFNSYMGQVMKWIGIVATVIAIPFAMTIRKWSWTTNALVPPLILATTGIGFFAFLIYQNTVLGQAISAFLGTTPLLLSVFFGSMQHCLARATKYTVFDATKELAFIPLSKESKLKGKAAIDGVGSRLGKSGGSIVYQGLLILFGTVGASVPYIGIILLIAVAVWVAAIYALGKQFHELTTHHQVVDIPDTEAPVFKKQEVVS